MRKIITYLCFAIFAVAIIMPRGWCCLVPYVNTQHTAPSSPNADSCPFCNNQQSTEKDSDSNPFDSSRPFSGFCCCEKIYGGYVEKSNSLNDPTDTHSFVGYYPIFQEAQNSPCLAQANHFTYPAHQRIHVRNCQWLC
jgi:hypothetical protein